MKKKIKKSRSRKKKAEEEEEDLSDDETDDLVNAWISSIDDLREFCGEHSPEEEGDIFYDGFLERFQIVDDLFHVMINHGMIVQGTREEAEETMNFEPKQIKGQRNDN